MPSLELKIPPPALAAVLALLMWAAAPATPGSGAAVGILGVVAAAPILVGLGFMVAGVVQFRRARTTVNPKQPQTASSLVTGGVYGITRNPMYLGLGLVLIAWAVLLSSAWGLLGPLIFVAYINRFQIAPEERALSARFGVPYAAYRKQVRRWL